MKDDWEGGKTKQSENETDAERPGMAGVWASAPSMQYFCAELFAAIKNGWISLLIAVHNEFKLKLLAQNFKFHDTSNF